MKLIRTLLLALAAGAVINCGGCSGDSGGSTIGTEFAQCDKRSLGYADSSTEMTSTLNALMPPGVEVRCTDKRVFALEDREVVFTYVVYGRLNDCPAGCFASDVCAIVDGKDALLYSATWYNGEVPLSIPPDCPELSGKSTGDTIRQCGNPPAGFLHALAQTDAFMEFRGSQGGGEFRWCF